MALRLTDVVTGLPRPAATVVAVLPEGVDATKWVAAPAGTTVVSDPGVSADVPRGGDVVTVVAVRADSPPDLLERALSRVADEAYVVVLMGWQPPDVPWHVVADPLVRHDCQVVDVMPVSVRQFPVAAVARKGLPLTVPSLYLRAGALPGTEGSAEQEQDAPDAAATQRQLTLRIAAEAMFLGLQDRALRGAIEDARSGQEAVAGELAELRARADTETHQLRRERDEALAALQGRTEERDTARAAQAAALSTVSALRSSRRWQIGEALSAARRPRGAAQLPGQVVRIWRKR